jgi:hypothetical protein
LQQKVHDASGTLDAAPDGLYFSGHPRTAKANPASMPDFPRKHVHATFPVTHDHTEYRRNSTTGAAAGAKPGENRASITPDA